MPPTNQAKLAQPAISQRKRPAYQDLKGIDRFWATYQLALTKIDFGKQGFPAKMIQAFEGVADVLNAVVATRVPGGATTALIEARHDLKGYFIKAKSCNWGPMSGFLCRNPAFNKNGANGISFNQEEHLNYRNKYLVDKFGLPPNDDQEFIKRAFTQLKISDERKLALFDDASTRNPIFLKSVGDNLVYGLASDCPVRLVQGRVAQDLGRATVVMEFLMKKEGNLWAIYHGKVYKKARGEQAFQPYSPDGALRDPLPVSGTRLGMPDASHIQQLKTEWLKPPFNIQRDDTDNWKTVDGLMNPYPPNKPFLDEAGTQPNPNYYLNAVSGDYDLFSVWPIIPPGGFLDLIRVTEEPNANQVARKVEYKNWDDEPLANRIYLSPVPGKGLTLELIKSREVYIEFIPDGDDIKELENAYKGNINKIVEEAVGFLNSFVGDLYPGTSSNVAFHSDEGGRPFVNDLEYPIAFFLPSAFAASYGFNTALMVENHLELLALINFLQGKFYIPLNLGWFRHWFAIIPPPPNPPAKKSYSIANQIAYYNTQILQETDPKKKEKLEGKKTYWEKRDEEFTALAQQDTDKKIIEHLENLFTPNTLDPTAQDFKKEMNNNLLAFDRIKEIFWEIAADDQITPAPTNPVHNYIYWKSQLERLFPANAPATT